MKNGKFIIFISYLILILGVITMIAPFLWMLVTSFMQDSQIFSYPPQFVPKPFITDNYSSVATKMPIMRYFYNSLLVAVLTTIGQVIIASMAGFAFAKLNFKFKEPLFLIILATMMIPPQVNIIPLFYVMKELHWIDTFQALILPGLFGGFGIFLMRQWFKSIPNALLEAAKIDGCNWFQIYYKVALPLALPALSTLAIFTFITSWNGFMWPLIVTNSDTIRTLPVALAGFKGSFRETIEWGQLMACAVITTIPAILIFIAGQKFFIKGIMNASVKE
ncbi:MAG: carbohydrate ABC transporter permease [Candidatus Gastranaerophilales bacterium]|nr:carbohydrate ABC transporter permease [Candidatus Gastranaerophilales bacterium]